MADRSKFEKMLELLVNENKEAAEELFHEIVVEKSREIYESLLEEEDEDEVDEATVEEEEDDEIDEADEDDLDESDDDDLEEGFDLDEFQVSPDFMGGDETDNLANDVDAEMDGMDDMEMDDMDDAEGADDVESRVMDLEDAFEELKAEFEAMMSGDDEEDDEEGDMDFGGDDEEDDEEGDMDFGGDDEEDDEDEMTSKEAFTYEAKKPVKKDEKKDEKKPAKKTAGEEMREYVEKIGGAHYHQYGKMGDNGTNTKSVVAGKNDMGGTTANILRTDTEQGTEANKGQLKGSSLIKQTPQNMNTKNVNVPGSKTATKLSSVAKGHGAEKKGAGETADKSAGSMLNGAPKRAK